MFMTIWQSRCDSLCITIQSEICSEVWLSLHRTLIKKRVSDEDLLMVREVKVLYDSFQPLETCEGFVTEPETTSFLSPSSCPRTFSNTSLLMSCEAVDFQTFHWFHLLAGTFLSGPRSSLETDESRDVGQYLNYLRHLPHNQSKCLWFEVCKVSTVQQKALVIICVSCIRKLDDLVFWFRSLNLLPHFFFGGKCMLL